MLRKVFYYAKNLFRLFCVIILIYQILNVTIEYLSYPFDVTIAVNNDINHFELPSISICTLSQYIWNKTIIDNKFPNIIKQIEEKKIETINKIKCDSIYYLCDDKKIIYNITNKN